MNYNYCYKSRALPLLNFVNIIFFVLAFISTSMYAQLTAHLELLDKKKKVGSARTRFYAARSEVFTEMGTTIQSVKGIALWAHKYLPRAIGVAAWAQSGGIPDGRGRWAVLRDFAVKLDIASLHLTAPHLSALSVVNGEIPLSSLRI